MRLELAAQRHKVTLGQLAVSHHGADVSHHLRQSPALGIGRQHNAAFAVIAADLVGAVPILNAGQLGQGHSAGGRLHENLPQTFQRPCALRQAHHQVESPATLHDLSHFFTLDQTLQDRENLRHGHAILGCRRVIHPHGDLRGQHLFFDFQIGQTGNSGQSPTQGIGLTPQSVQVVTKQLNGDLGTHPGEHVINAVRNGLANGNGCGQIDQAAADVALNLGHAATQL